ncbi:hypothetical protein [Haladaptatus sp. DJG-WS-42]|uniref:DUF7410 domain-containing protein n=1 Tax=Haladaptatus sp. DJG-WS-42 TaxID=3120516 RepID=UPI0030CB3F4C
MTERIPETAVHDTDPPATYCRYCDQPFDSAQTRALHVGETHTDEWTTDDQTAYDEALTAEDDELWVYHMKVVVGLAVTYAIVVVVYMIVLG